MMYKSRTAPNTIPSLGRLSGARAAFQDIDSRFPPVEIHARLSRPGIMLQISFSALLIPRCVNNSSGW